MEERVKATEQEARRRALDDFMQDFRVEERHYFRENKSLAARKKSMVLQERLYFRNIPLSNWVEHEMTVEEETGDVQQISKYDGQAAGSVSAFVIDPATHALKLLNRVSSRGAGPC